MGAACLLGALALAGCGGSGAKPAQVVTGEGYSFSAPGGWKVTRTQASMAVTRGTEAVTVATFRLARPYRPELAAAAAKELDAVAAKLAAALGGSVVATRPVTVGGTTARRYDLAFTRNGEPLVERITFVLRGRREYQLLCRFKEGRHEPACGLLERSFRPG